MYRLVCALLACLLLPSCATDRLDTLQQNLTYAAQQRMKNTLAAHFIAELGKATGSVITGLSKPGGYLDNPLVRILLPPPVGLVVDLARDMHADPQASLLVVLMNRAAESAIPAAAPILQTALHQMTPAEARALLDGGGGAATAFLKAKTSAALHTALEPLVAAHLAASGAQQVYENVIGTYQQRNTDAQAAKEAAPDLVGYVTDQAVQGAFKALGKREEDIHESLDNAAAGLWQGTVESPASDAPAQTIPAAK